MSLIAEQYLTVCAAAQLAEVAPALEGSYAGGTAGGIGALILMGVQDIAGRGAREAAEHERVVLLFEAAGAAGHAVPDHMSLPALRSAVGALLLAAEESGDAALRLRILDHFVATAEAARLAIPEPGEAAS